MTLFDRVQDAIAKTLRVPAEKITATTTDEQIGAWDSVGHVNLMMALEDTFGISLDVEDFPRLNSVRNIMEHLQQQGVH